MGLLLLLVVVAALTAAYRVLWQRPGGPHDRRESAAALWQRREQERARRRARARARRLPPLPAEDAPPSGLRPLVDSPRTVRAEVVRGIRELEDWLADQATA